MYIVKSQDPMTLLGSGYGDFSNRYNYCGGQGDCTSCEGESCNGLHPMMQACKPSAFLNNSTGEFLLCATANLDGDPELDVWSMTSRGAIVHQSNDCR